MRASRGAVKQTSQQSSTVDAAAAAVVSVTMLLSALLSTAVPSMSLLSSLKTVLNSTEMAVESRCLTDRQQLLITAASLVERHDSIHLNFRSAFHTRFSPLCFPLPRFQSNVFRLYDLSNSGNPDDLA